MRTMRRLGRSDIEVSPIGLGCWQFSGGKGLAGGFWGALAGDEMDEIVRVSLEGGVTWFDTAYIYGKGRSEAALSHALRAAGRSDGDVVVATKWWPTLRTAGNVKRTIEDRLGSLSPFSIDLHQVHHPFSLATVGAQMRAMADLVEEGKIRSVGVSNFSAGAMRRAHAALGKRGLPLVSNQVRYSLLDRKIERNGVLETARELGVTIIAYSPLAQGLLTGRFHDDPGLVARTSGYRKWLPSFRAKRIERCRPLVDLLRRIGAAHSATAAQVALAWTVRYHGEAVTAIPGASRPDQARGNAAAMDLALADRELADLDQASRAVG